MSLAILHLPRSRPYRHSMDHVRDCLKFTCKYALPLALRALSAVSLAVFATSPGPLWDNIRVKHTWGTAPDNWELVGPIPARRTSKYTGNENEAILRIVSYSFPEALHPNVHTVALTTLFAYQAAPSTANVTQALQRGGNRDGKYNIVGARGASDEQSSCIQTVGPALATYRTETYVPTTPRPQNSLGILGLQNNYPTPSYLTQSVANYRQDLNPYRPPFTILPHRDS